MKVFVFFVFSAIIFTGLGIYMGAEGMGTVLTSNDCIQACLDEVQTFKIGD